MALPFELLDCIEFWARHRSNAVALTVGARSLTYLQLSLEIERVGGVLGSEIQTGRVAVFASQKFDTTIAVLAGLWRGYSVVVLNPWLPPESIAHCIESTRPVAALVADCDLRQWESARANSITVADLPSHLLSAAANQKGHARSPSRSSTDEWAVLYSSGSTGAPKGIERDFESMQTEFLGWCLELGLGTHTRFYIGRPVFYTGGLVLTMSTLIGGGTVCLNDVPERTAQALVDDIAETARDGKHHWAFLVPDQVRALLGYAGTQRIAGVVGGVLVMGAPIAGREKQELAAMLRCTVRESWGNSESLGTITDDDMLRECPDSIGRPFLSDSMCIVDEDGEPCPGGTIGRIAGGEAAGFTKYTARPGDTAAAKRNGLIISEDIGWSDSRGRFFIAGRIQEMVQLDGGTRFLPQLENELRSTGLTGTFCLAHRSLGGRDELGLLFERDTVSETEVRSCLERAKCGTAVSVVGAAETLPRTASGKVDRGGAASVLWPKV